MANQFYVEPAQFGQGLSALAGSVQQFGQQRQAQQKAEAQKAYEQQAKQAVATALQSGDPRMMQQVSVQFPEVAESMRQAYGFTNDLTEQAAKAGYRQFLGSQDPTERLAILEGTVDTIAELGGRPIISQQDVERFKRDPEGTAKSIEMAYAGIDPDGYEALTGGASGPSIGTYNPRDYTTESFAEFTRTNDPSVLERYADQRTVDIGGVPHVFDPARGGYYPASVAGASEGQAPRTVTTADVAGSQGEIAATEEASKQAIKMSGEAREKLGSVRQSIPLYDRAIEIVEEEGANTGAIASRFPSIQQSSVALDDIQRQLGLNVLQNTTFGALSEGELRLALQAGLPTSLEGPALVKELKRRREAQEKLADYLEEASIFLGTPGNTPADWMRSQRDKRQKSSETKRIRLDAEGNIIQ